jgi:hypothetical protein
MADQQLGDRTHGGAAQPVVGLERAPQHHLPPIRRQHGESVDELASPNERGERRGPVRVVGRSKILTRSGR